MTTAVLNFGDIDDRGAASRTVPLTLPTTDLCGGDGVTALTNAGVTAADIRARTILKVDDIAATDLAVLVSTLFGFTGRWVHINLNGEMIDLPQLAGHTPKAGPRPETPALEVIGMSSQSHLSDAPHAHRALLSETMGPAELLVALVVLSTLRRRASGERFPLILTTGEEEVRLEDARRAGARMRTDARTATQGPLAPKADVSPRIERMNTAAATPITDALTRQGATADDDGKWTCPRTGRHNQDNPSSTVVVHEDNTARCYRCDPERVDTVRLVAAVRGCTGDEAAEWLLAAS